MPENLDSPVGFSISEFNSGRETSFDMLFKHYYAGMCHFAERIIHDDYEAEEIVQSAFIALWKKRANFNDIIKIKAFLYVTIKNATFNILKKRKVKLKVHQILGLGNNTSEEIIIEQIIYTEVMRSLEEAVGKLPNKCQEVIRLSYFEDKRSSEIADLLHTTVSTVDNQRARGILLLKKRLTKFGLLFLYLLSVYNNK